MAFLSRLGKHKVSLGGQKIPVVLGQSSLPQLDLAPPGFILPPNQPLKNRIRPRQQPVYGQVPPLRTYVAPPVPQGFIKQVNQPLRNRVVKRQQPDYGKVPPLRTAVAVQVPPVSSWKRPVEQPRIVRKRQQPQSYGTFWAQIKGFVVPALLSWQRPTNQPVRGKKRSQPAPNQPPPLRTAVAAAVPTGFIKPTQQPQRKTSRQQPIYKSVFPTTPTPNVPKGFFQPTQQPIRKTRRQQPAPNQKPFVPPAGTPTPTGFQRTISQPYIRRTRQQPQRYGNFWQQNKAFVVPVLEGWVQPTNQPVRGKRRQQINRVGVFAAALVAVPPVNQWVQKVQQPLRRTRRQQPQRYGNAFYDIPPQAVPVLNAWVQQVNQPLKSRIRPRQQVNRTPLGVPINTVAPTLRTRMSMGVGL
jgi:hypothetical protein